MALSFPCYLLSLSCLTHLIRRFYNAVRMLNMVSFKQITQILELTDSLGMDREWVEIPLSSESPGVVRKLANGKLEIVVDANVPFEEWLASLKPKIMAVTQG